MKKLSFITETFTESVIREMTRICDAIGGINLSQGFPDFDTPEELKALAIEAIRSGRNQYPVTFGEPILRGRIAEKMHRFNRVECDPATDITVCCGATEAMLSTLKAIINPGDEVIIFEPFYENYGPDAILSGAKPRYVPLTPPDWSYDQEQLNSAFNNHTKAIILNTPNNPTGKVFSREELEGIALLCLKWDVFAVTDEIYEHIMYDGSEHISLASIDGMSDRTITINSASKTYSATGWRVGWAVAVRPITERIRKVHDFVTVGAPTPLQHAAAEALRFPDEYYRSLADRYQEARNLFLAGLTGCGFQPYEPKGSYYVMADTKAARERLGAGNDVDFTRLLVNKTGVAAVPGSAFYSDPAVGLNQARFAFCKKPETLRKALQLLKDAALLGND